jgi:hypothetical protein
MHFVDGHRFFQMVFTGALVQPLLVVPLIAFKIADDGGGLRRNFHCEPVRIGFLLAKTTGRRTDGILVICSRADSGKKNLPDPSGAQPHGMPAVVPIVEVANHTDHFRVRRPHHEADAMHALTFDRVRAHAAITLVLRSFAMNVEVKIGNQARKAIRIFDVYIDAAPKYEAELISSRIVGQRDREKPFRPDFAHGMDSAIQYHASVHSLRKECTHFPAIPHLMGT